MLLSPVKTLSNGVEIPMLGFGTALIGDFSKTKESVKAALRVGYRHLDTAMIYKNEDAIGAAIAEAGIPREELFITTKVWNSDIKAGTCKKAFQESLEKLGLDYIDLYLLHWPVRNAFLPAWHTVEELYKSGQCRAIGVCNFRMHHLSSLLPHCEIIPMVNQCEFHPQITHPELRAYCKECGIAFEAWKPLGGGIYWDNPLLYDLGRKYQKTVAQILLRWDFQNDVIAIPKTASANRAISNFQIFDFELSAEDMSAISALNQNMPTDPPPEDVDL